MTFQAFRTISFREERQVLSVANLTRADGVEFFDIVPKVGITTQTTSYPLARANEALSDLRSGRLQGAAVSSR